MNSDRFQRIDRSLAGEYTCLYLLLQTVGIWTTNANKYTNRQFNKFLPKSLEVQSNYCFTSNQLQQKIVLEKNLSTIHHFYAVKNLPKLDRRKHCFGYITIFYFYRNGTYLVLQKFQFIFLPRRNVRGKNSIRQKILFCRAQSKLVT